MPKNSENTYKILAVVEELTAMLLTTYFLVGVMEVLSASLRGLGYSILQMVLYVGGICATRLIWISAVFPSLHTPLGLMLCYPVSWSVTIIALSTARFFARKKIKAMSESTKVI
jgi:hypothetical protein